MTLALPSLKSALYECAIYLVLQFGVAAGGDTHSIDPDLPCVHGLSALLRQDDIEPIFWESERLFFN